MKKLFLTILFITIGTALGIWLEANQHVLSKLPESIQVYFVIKDNDKIDNQPKILYWVAPMDPNYRRDKPGKSPMGMDLIPVYEEEKTVTQEPKILYWVAPMDPNYRRDKPGKSPMGMDLIPVYEEEGEVEDATVKISSAVVNNLGVRTVEVLKQSLEKRIDTVGYITQDETKIAHIHLRTQGWIEQLLVKAEGEQVTKGQLLFKLYSPDLVNAQAEFLQALNSSHKSLITASENRLLALGMSSEQIKQFKHNKKVQQHINVYAPQAGILSKLNIREGMHVKPATIIMSLVDLSSIWLVAEVFERQANWVKVGQMAEAKLSFLPSQVWKGKVDFVYPDLDPKTRTLKVRLRFDNPKTLLKPNMYAYITIYSSDKEPTLVIPTLALIRSGQGERVIIAKGEGQFEARIVTTGIESGDKTEVISGLEEGEQVVVSAQFLIDSESNLKASFLRMSEPDKIEEKAIIEDKTETSEADKMDMPIMGKGLINSVGDGEVNISHQPIEALGWGAMTMDLQVSDNVDLSTVKAGDKVHFILKKTGEHNYLIDMIHVFGHE